MILGDVIELVKEPGRCTGNVVYLTRDEWREIRGLFTYELRFGPPREAPTQLMGRWVIEVPKEMVS